MKNPIFSQKPSNSAKGYSAFPLDHLANFTSVCGYLLPVYWSYLSPGDKVTMSTLLRTRTQPFTKPSMGTIIERVEWFAVPIDQLYKPFSAQYYGINDIQTDMLPTKGYDTVLPFMKASLVNDVIKTSPTTLKFQSTFPDYMPTCQEAKRLCDCLGAPENLGLANVPDGETLPYSIGVLPFAAYHKIFFDHYRLTDRVENDPHYYNFDSFNTSHEVSDRDRVKKLLTLHKRPYQLDYFTSMKVSPLMGSADVNASGSDLGKINQWLSGLQNVVSGVPNSALFNVDGYVQPNSTSPSSVRLPNATGSYTNAAVGLVNPSNIRSLFAVEKLLEVTRRAKKHYDMQTLAHFGVDVPTGLSGECYKLGTHEQYINIGEVISTANTSEGSLGERAGIGSSNDKSKKFHFEAKCHCILMAIYSAEPLMNYMPYGVSRELSLIDTNSFYKSEFDNLGMQPIFARELDMDVANESDAPNYARVVGWTDRYAEFKAKYNRSFCGIASQYFQEWAFNRDHAYWASNTKISDNFFYVWPTDLNYNLLVQYTGDGDCTKIYSDDYFINQIYFDIVKSSKMSIHGIPNL